jgi:hypothetical protein
MLTAQICPFGTEYKTGKTRQMARISAGIRAPAVQASVTFGDRASFLTKV